MSSDDCQRSKWRRVVWRTRKIPNSVRLLLLLLTDAEIEGHRGMDRRGYVSVPRRALADALGVTCQRVTERMQLAHEAGLLDTVRRGRPGVTAEYQALIPKADSPHVRTTRAGTDSPDVRTKLHGPETRTPTGPDVRTTKRRSYGPHVPVATVVPQRSRSDVAGTATSALRRSDDEVDSQSTVRACEHGMPGGDQPDEFVNGRLRCPQCALLEAAS